MQADYSKKPPSEDKKGPCSSIKLERSIDFVQRNAKEQLIDESVVCADDIDHELSPHDKNTKRRIGPNCTNQFLLEPWVGLPSPKSKIQEPPKFSFDETILSRQVVETSKAEAPPAKFAPQSNVKELSTKRATFRSISFQNSTQPLLKNITKRTKLSDNLKRSTQIQVSDRQSKKINMQKYVTDPTGEQQLAEAKRRLKSQSGNIKEPLMLSMRNKTHKRYWSEVKAATPYLENHHYNVVSIGKSPNLALSNVDIDVGKLHTNPTIKQRTSRNRFFVSNRSARTAVQTPVKHSPKNSVYEYNSSNGAKLNYLDNNSDDKMNKNASEIASIIEDYLGREFWTPIGTRRAQQQRKKIVASTDEDALDKRQKEEIHDEPTRANCISQSHSKYRVSSPGWATAFKPKSPSQFDQVERILKTSEKQRGVLTKEEVGRLNRNPYFTGTLRRMMIEQQTALPISRKDRQLWTSLYNHKGFLVQKERDFDDDEFRVWPKNIMACVGPKESLKAPLLSQAKLRLKGES